MYHKKKVAFTQGRGGISTAFSLSSNYTVSECLGHEGKATVNQLQIHKKNENISLLAYSNSKYFFFLNAE